MATDRKPSGTRGGLAPAQRVELVSLVSYQQGSVVSRTLMNNRADTVALFAFDEGRRPERAFGSVRRPPARP